MNESQNVELNEEQIVEIEINILAAISVLIQSRNSIIDSIENLQALLKDLRH